MFYEVDGPAVLARLEAMLQHMKSLAPFCCPGVSE